jgi:hypothetical protein
MKGTWGRRVFGTIQKGPTYTRFHLEITLLNGCPFYQVIEVRNEELAADPRLYKHILDKMTEKLEQRVKDRLF